jgi:hypothetical protein
MDAATTLPDWLLNETAEIKEILAIGLPLVSHPHYHRPGIELRDFRNDLLRRGLTKYQCRQVIGRSRTRVLCDESRPEGEYVSLSLKEYTRLSSMIEK